MQLPQRASNREEAVRTIRQAAKLCTLMDNQTHCVKNHHFLIVN